ncbi:MAG: TlpA family protein disulfide reductase [Planctomycetes bacterium]|nr:TlpA family protein disulfide reductase [Planctomycetota bacterium]MCB9885316.1 TlpA family protein disulfide reductase [Planctomycetota bacterium]
MSMRSCVCLAAFVLAPSIAIGQGLSVGAPAPAITADGWLNWEGDAPTLESLAGRVVMIEFWGTWCGPCVRAMPGIQKLHDRYRERGLTVLAISYEPIAKMEPFLQSNGYTMPVGSDLAKNTITAYGVRGWPKTILIDKEGKIAHIGSPYDAEAAVEKALGLEAGPASLLNTWLDSLGGSKDGQRQALERLTEKAASGFDLQAWALSHCTPKTVTDEGDTTAPNKSSGKKVDGAETLRRCIKSWSNEAQRQQALQQLADGGPTDFDLAAFSEETFAKTFPLDAKELETMLADKKYAGVVEAIARRAPAARTLAAATKDKDLVAFCKGKADGARLMAKKGLIAQLYVFPGALPKDENVNQKLWGELSISGVATSPDRKTITGIMLGGEMLARDQADGFVAGKLAQALIMESLADGKAPRLGTLRKDCDAARAALQKELEGRYGAPEPREEK